MMEAFQPKPDELQPTLKIVPVAENNSDFSHDAEILELFVREMQTTEDPVHKEMAFTNLMRSTEDRIRNVIARHITDSHRAEDVMSETYTRVWEYANNFEFRSTVNTWLFRIATNTSLRHLEKAGRSKDLLTSFHENDDEDLSLSEREIVSGMLNSLDPEGFVADNEQTAAILTALKKIPKKQAEAVILSDIVGLKHAEIAERVGISETASKVRLHRGRKRLKDLLIERGQL